MSEKIVPALVESPYSGLTDDVVMENVAYAERALAHAYSSGKYAPIATHLLWTKIGKTSVSKYVSDTDKNETVLGRDHALKCADVLRETAVTLFYCDRGVSGGMLRAMKCVREKDLKYLIIFLDDHQDEFKYDAISKLMEVRI